MSFVTSASQLENIFKNKSNDIAIVFENEKTSYENLNTSISKLANKLLSCGVNKDDYVIISLPRSTNLMVAILASLKIGAFYIPLEADNYSERLAFIKKDCNAKLVIDEKFISGIETEKETDIVCKGKGGCVIYTSGSTGNPKGVQIPTSSIELSVQSSIKTFMVKSSIKYLYLLPFSFVAHLFFNLTTLACGGTLYILNNKNRKDIYKIQNYILQNNITHTLMPPQLFKLFTLKKSNLEIMFVASEKAVNISCTGDYKLFNAYGSSEALFSTYFEITKKYENTPIGKPMFGKDVILVDENNNITDNEGEICVSGAIFEKYLNNEHETAQKLIHIGGKTYFKTNDIAKKEDDENLVYLNRKDWMVKICGHRVEPGEIETAVRSFSELIDTVVVKAFTNEYGQNYLCCYIKTDKTINIEDLKLYLGKKLPSYMIPAFFTYVKDFPLNQNGKIDRKSLLSPSSEQYRTEYIAPQTDDEIRIVKSFEKILNIKNIGLNDDFFMLGGNSIMTIMLLNDCNLNLSPADIMEAKTPKNIAKLIKNKQSEKDIMHYDIRSEYELTDSEKGIYLEWQQDKNKTNYNIPCCCTFKKNSVKTSALKKAIMDFVNNHSALKANFVNRNGEIIKLRNDEKTVKVAITNAKEEEISYIKKRFVKPFNLENDDLFRFEICETENQIYFLSDIHHIVTDGTSVAVMLNDIKNSLLGKEPEKEEITSFDLNLYEKELKNSEKYKKSKEFFENKFIDKELTLSLPSDVYKNSLISDDVECSFNFDEEICSNNLSAFLNKNGLTENTLFIGAFAYCIAKFLNENEITFRSVNDGRFSKKLKNTVGMLVKTIPLVYKIDETIKIKEYLKEVQTDFYKTIDNSDFTYMDFVSNIGINPDLMFVYQSDMLNGFEINNEIIELEELENKDLISNFSAMVFKFQNKYRINLKYNNKLYTKDYIKSFLNFYNQVLKEFLHKETLKDIELVNADDIDLIKSFSKQRKVIDETKTFVDLFKEQVEKTPENIALVYQQNKYTYKQLDEITDKLAKYLISKGVKPNEYVGIYINRSEFMQISEIGVLKSGAAYQPLDSKNPIDRLNFMIKDSEAKVIITSADLENTITYNGEKLLIENILSLPDSNIELPKINKDDKFVLLYTSGSTGMPKGVELLHRNLTNYMVYYQEYGEFSEETRCLAYASFGFDVHMSEVFSTFISGGTVFVASDEMKLNIVELHKYLLENKITFLFTATQFMKQYATMFPDNPYLKKFFAGGEKLPNIRPPNYNIYNAYGPSECTVFMTAFLVEKDLNFIPIGHTLGNNTSYIVDKYERLLPVGASGELYIAGAQVGKGYLKRDDLNKEKFIANPYDTEFKNLYKSGDICRFLIDGNIDIIGRKDFQVKIRGFRIELTEIENKILEYKDIKDATVIAKDSPSGGKYIAAYIVSDKNIEINELNNFIKKSLPAYMVPEVTMQINEIPHNVNGKVDKRKLPEPVRVKKEKSETAPRELNYIEKVLSDILAESLGHNNFDIMTNFTEAGMTSITAMKFSALIYKKFNYEVKSSTLLGECNIFSIENIIQEFLLNKKDTAIQNNEKNKDNDENTIELSQNQMGIYYETLKNPASTIYNIPLELTLDKKLDVEKLKTSFEKVLDNHQIVNSYLIQKDEKVLLARNTANSKINIQKMKEAEYQNFRTTFSKPFDLFKFPLYQTLIVKTECNIHLIFDIHHILFDGISEGIFVSELINNYCGKPVLKEEMSYFEFIKQEKLSENSEKYKNAENIFNDLLKNFETATEIKSDVKEKAFPKLVEYIKTTDTKKVKNFCSKNNITPAQLFLAASGYAIARFTNTKEVYISTISNGRNNPRLQSTFGMFVKTLPLNVEIQNGKSVLEFISDTGKMFRNVIDSDIYPYTKISENFGFMPKIVYACQLGVISNNEIGGTDIKVGNLGLNTPKFPLSIHIEENRNQEIVINLQYDSSVYTNDIIARLSDAINATLSNMIDFSSFNIEKISMLNEAEENKLKTFRYSAKKDLEISLLHKLFEKSVDTTPDKTALISTDGEYTYKELEKWSNIIANSLIRMGVKTEDKIAILLPRTSNIFKSIFGVLKSGAAYIPCDTEYPKERIEQIINDSGAKYTITDAARLSLYKNAVNIDDLLNSTNDKRPDISVKSDNLAYMIYTSGSTGKPKGVMIEHKGICNYVNPHKENRHVNAFVEEAEIMLSITTISFDMALKEFATALCNSKTLVFANEEETKNIIELTKLFQKTHADAFNSTPSRMQQFLEWDDFAKNLAKCKVIMCGAENYPINLYKKLKSLTNARLFNTYGPTEITVSSNCLELTDSINQVTIGKPLLNYEEFIVDSDGNELPAGVTGELYISGLGVARGYRNLEEQTKEKFIEYKGKRVYKSGDFAKWTDNGQVIILGRMDNQVKLRGLRIELDEIQKAVYDFDRIKNAVVVVKKINNVENLCAYFEAEKEINIGELKKNLESKLPAYMVPAAYMQMDKLPTTRNGKADKKNLPDIVVEKEEKTKDYTNKTEQDFCEIFAKVLNLDIVSVNDNFFETGGSSLLATRVIIEAKKLNYNITYGDVFAEKTPKNLARLFSNKIEDENDAEFSDYDYSKINKILEQNTIENFVNKKKQELGDIIITGVTGFLGIHVLVEFIKNETGKAYCLIRKGEFEKPEDRLKTLLFYYFDNAFEDLFKERITVIDGDITNKDCLKKFDRYNTKTFINCAANVKHFSEKNDIEEVNYNGVLNIIDYCKKNNMNLIQVSTMSIGGFSVDNKPSVNTQLEENMLFFGQYLSGKYVKSKFKAERAVLEAISDGLNAKIMRVGNLSARDTDGEFQINFNTNSFVGRLKAYKLIKKYPYSMINTYAEFSPIDCVARAILLLAKTPKECCIFHPYNNHGIFMGDIIATMQDRGMKIDFAEQEIFEKAIIKAQENKENSTVLSSLIAYQNMGHGKLILPIKKSNELTIQALFRMGFKWPIPSTSYMNKFFKALEDLGFFGD